jgi:hypothetical protein
MQHIASYDVFDLGQKKKRDFSNSQVGGVTDRSDRVSRSNVKKSSYLVGSYAGFMASANFENDSSIGTDSLFHNNFQKGG